VSLAVARSAVAADPRPLATLMAGPSCPDGAVTTQLEAGLRRNAAALLPHPRTAAALARVRARRALEQARQLYTRTDFSGCISLLSITEQELGRSLADTSAPRERQAHDLLARVNLWLGICQWAAGDPQTAAAAFVRATQLPGNPAPDPKLLPPELIEAHRAATAAPRQEMTCDVEAPLAPEHLLVDGRRPALVGSTFRVSAGTHYLALKVVCAAGRPECARLQDRLGPEGMRSLRLEAGPLRCRVAFPPVPAIARVTCASLEEAKDSTFVAELGREADAAGTLVVAVSKGSVALRLQRGTAAVFSRQLVTQLEGLDTPSRIAARSVDLLLSGAPPRPPPPPPPRWYERWWVWAVVGAAVVATTSAAVAVGTRSHEARVVFGP
jgi:hypothetical protein